MSEVRESLLGKAGRLVRHRPIFCVASTLVFEAVVAIAGFRCYVNYCYVDSWLEGCRPHMTVGEVFSVVPYRFHRDCPLKQVDRAMPHVCFFPSDCSKVELEYSCRLRSDVDGLCLFASSCELYFDKDRRLVGIEYIPYHYTMDNNAWKQFIACRSSGPTSNAVVVAPAAGSEVYMPVTDLYVQKWERHE